MPARISKLWLPTTQQRVVHTRINGYEILVLANEDVGRCIYFRRSFELAETRFFRAQIRPDDVCVDVGGNVGYFALLMARLASNGEVHVFEPIPLNITLLAASLSLNHFDHVRLNQCAVGASAGEVTFSISADSAYSSMHDTKRKPLDRILTVPMISLDAYVQKSQIRRVDIVKADVEGAEGLVVEGAAALLSDSKRGPRIVLLELYEPNMAAFKTNVAEVIGRMGGFGYRAFVAMRDGNVRPFRDEDKTRYYNILFMR